jgi:hypothetical protein
VKVLVSLNTKHLMPLAAPLSLKVYLFTQARQKAS